jgi:hypothetical protein
MEAVALAKDERVIKNVWSSNGYLMLLAAAIKYLEGKRYAGDAFDRTNPVADLRFSNPLT